jgi:hypothetical protein
VTSFRQIEANRRNSLRSTGPVTEAGKERSRRNAVRHGLCAETVVGMIEDVEDYKGFEAAIIADYDAETAVERELVLRLSSLLWRIRRATSIETNLLGLQAEVSQGQHYLPARRPNLSCEILSVAVPRERTDMSLDADGSELSDLNLVDVRADAGSSCPADPPNRAKAMARSFQQLVHFDSAVFERLGRYESALARQIVQVLFLLQSARRRY